MADTFILGGTGTMADSATNNGGGYLSGGSVTYTTCQKSNGGPVSCASAWGGSQTACNVVSAGPGGAAIYEPEADGFEDCLVGTWAYIEFLDVGYDDDWYLIHTNVADYIQVYAYGDTTTCDIHVGGALGMDATSVINALDLVSTDDTVLACTDTTTSTEYDIDGTIYPAATAGASLTPIVIKGANKDDGTNLSLTDARPIFKASTILANGIINFNSSATDYYRWENIIFDGDNKAAYCVYCNVAADWHYWINCLFKNSTSTGLYCANGEYWTLNNCEDLDCGGNGSQIIGPYGLIINHTSVNSAGHGCLANGTRGIIVQSTSLNNTQNGYIVGGHGGVIINSTAYNNDQWGIRCSSSGSFLTCINNTADGDLYDYFFNGINTHIAYFGNNHANGTNYSELCSNDNFPDFLKGYNITDDPKFISTADGSEDFDLLFDSPLQRNGINNTTIGAGSRVEITEGRQDVAFAAIYIQEEDVS